MTPLYIFAASFALLALFLLLKYWELVRGRRFFERPRAALDRLMSRWYRFFASTFPYHGKRITLHSMRELAIAVGTDVLAVIRFLERKLLQLLRWLREKGRQNRP